MPDPIPVWQCAYQRLAVCPNRIRRDSSDITVGWVLISFALS